MELGCFNRPWTGCELDRAFAGIASAGFQSCGLLRHSRQAILSAARSPEANAVVLEAAASHGLRIRCNLVTLALSEPIEVASERLKAEIDQARAAGIPHLLTTGATDPARYEAFFAVLQATAPYAAGRGVTLGVKPHGGVSATNRDCIGIVERIGRDGLGIWYDPGNIMHYTGTDPEVDLTDVAPHLVGMCVKDCAGGKGGSVALTPGDGVVNFARIFRALRDAGFQGPALVECLGGATPAQVDAEARRVYNSLMAWTGG